MIEETLNSMRKRMSWTEARKLIANVGLPTSQGWVKSIDRIKAGDYETFDGPLQDALIEHILAGGKFIKLFEFDPEERETYQAALRKVALDESDISAAFPQQFEDDELDDHQQGFIPVDTYGDTDGFGLITSTAFQIKKREQIDFEELEDPGAYLGRYEEIYGVKLRWVQIMSVIWIPHHRDQIELRIDHPKGMSQQEAHALLSGLRIAAENWLGDEIGPKPVNLFPAVRPFYDDRKEGKVTEIMFATTTGGLKNEKIIKKRGAVDQRDEAYHKAGKEGLEHDINLYQVTVEWLREDGGLYYVPSLSLGATGPSGKSKGGMPVISGVAINGCVRTTDYEFVIERLSDKLAIGQ